MSVDHHNANRFPHYVKGKGAYKGKNCIRCSVTIINRYRGKTTLCKNCTAQAKKEKEAPSACLLFLFLLKLQNYEYEIWNKIALMEVGTFTFKLSRPRTTNNYMDIYRIGKYPQLFEKRDIRHDPAVYKYIMKHKTRLLRHYNTNRCRVFDGERVDIIPCQIPLIYLPFTYLQSERYHDDGVHKSITLEETLVIDFMQYEVCMLRKIVKDKLKLEFSPKTADLRCIRK